MRISFKQQTGIIFAALLVSTSASAGIPVAQEVTCPVGGETFTVEGTASCSTMGRMLSLRAITSCDFITRLPVCPKNKLPMYREFTEDEVKNIEAFMKTNAYKDALDEPLFLRAYHLSKTLEDDESVEPFFLLQSAIWYGENSPEISDLYQKELQQARSGIDEADLPFWLAAASFEAWTREDVEAAKQGLQDAKSHADPENEYLGRYIARLDACYKGDLSGDDCLATTEIPDE